jgi:hypothetical protein
MGLLDGLSDLIFGGSDQKTLPPIYKPYSTPAPQYQSTPGYDAASTALQNVLIKRMLGNYQQGKPILDQNYRNAVLGQAQRSADQQAQESSRQLGEQFNQYNLLNSSAMGTGQGLIQRERQREVADSADKLTQAELGQLNNAISGAQSYAGLQGQEGARKLAADQFGYTAGRDDYQNVYTSEAARAKAEADQKNTQRSKLLEGLFGLGKAGVMAASGGTIPW